MIVKETRPSSNQVRLTQQEIAGVILTVVRVIRAECRAFRDFQGIVEANEHAVANITTLVRGRVVVVDLGQPVMTGQVLAVLSSSDFGTAQSTYLKASAKLHVAQHAAARAKRLLAENVIGLGEDQRRQGEMIGITYVGDVLDHVRFGTRHKARRPGE